MDLNDIQEAVSKATHEDDEYSWPPPPKVTTVMLDGELAERIRFAWDIAEDLPVTLTTTETVGGYSEYTSWTSYEFEIECSDFSWYSGSHDHESNGLSKLLNWLNDNAPEVESIDMPKWKKPDND